MLKIGEVAQQIGVHIATIRRWADAGKIAYIRSPNGTRLFYEEDVDNFLMGYTDITNNEKEKENNEE